MVRRGYPRVAPGRISLLQSDWTTGALDVEATNAKAGAALLLWTPTTAATHVVTAVGVQDLQTHDVVGGQLVSGSVAADGAWSVKVTPK